jgi:predicted ArsR family transcriptional regulator
VDEAAGLRHLARANYTEVEPLDWIATFLGGTRARILALLRRSASTIADLANEVGVTGNAVRGHVTALQKDGLVREAGTAPSTGGKPAQLFDLTREGEEAFPKAYAFVLQELLRKLKERDGREATVGILKAVGQAAAGAAGQNADDPGARVAAAADVLRSIGGDVNVTRVEKGWEIRGFGCPLSAVVVNEPDTCCLAQGLVADVTGAEVLERCDRSGGRARCAFQVLES